jgi:uncharacterized protein (DUF427 family)
MTRVEPGQKRIRAYVDGELVADTIHPLLVWEVPYYPTYYWPAADVRAKLEPTEQAGVFDLVTARRTIPAVARQFDESTPELHGTVRLEWSAMDEWLEEDEPIYTHARDPYKRVDILASSRHVRVELDGVVLADSHSPRLLFETGLPARYYLPLSDLTTGLLVPSPKQTHCPYKGMAEYWSVQIGDTRHDNIVWIYRAPLPESQKIAGLACFYNERVDLYVDGVLQERARTPFS